MEICSIEVPDKADFQKLRQKRGILMGADDMAKALEAMGKAAAAKSNDWNDFASPITKFTQAFRAFKAKNAKSHPKFIEDVQRDYQVPCDKIVKEIEAYVKKSTDVKKGLRECETFLHEMLSALRADDAAGAKKALAPFGSVLGGVKNNVHDLKKSKAPIYEEVDRVIEEIRSLKNPVDRDLALAEKAGAEPDMAPMIKSCQTMGRLLVEVEKRL